MTTATLSLLAATLSFAQDPGASNTDSSTQKQSVGPRRNNDTKPANGTLTGTGPSPYGSGGSPNSASAAGYTGGSRIPYTQYGRDNPANGYMPPRGESAGPPEHGRTEHAGICPPHGSLKVDQNCHVVTQTIVVQNVDFVSNSDRLTPPSRKTLDQFAKAIVPQSGLQVSINGYTDNVDSASYNLGLSRRRAESVRAYLISQGSNASELHAQGFGKAHPIASNATAKGRAHNRRVEFVIVAASTSDPQVQSTAASEESETAAETGTPVKK